MWLNFVADCKTAAQAQEVPTSLIEQLSHSGVSTPQASDSLVHPTSDSRILLDAPLAPTHHDRRFA